MMIKITGKRGEGAGLLTNLAVEQILKDYPNCICLLLDDTSEFYPLENELDGIGVHISPAYLSLNEYQEFIAERINKSNLFRISYSDSEYKLEDIEESVEEFANILRNVYCRRTFIIYKSAY